MYRLFSNNLELCTFLFLFDKVVNSLKVRLYFIFYYSAYAVYYSGYIVYVELVAFKGLVVFFFNFKYCCFVILELLCINVPNVMPDRSTTLSDGEIQICSGSQVKEHFSALSWKVGNKSKST